jgi:hypothetical protein
MKPNSTYRQIQDSPASVVRGARISGCTTELTRPNERHWKGHDHDLGGDLRCDLVALAPLARRSDSRISGRI